MRDRKVDEHLVIGVTAAAGRRIGRRSRMRQRVESREHGSRFKPTLREPRGDQRVAKHAREFFAHGRRGEPAQFAAPQRRSQRPAGWVVEHQQVERDIGVQDKVHAPIVAGADYLRCQDGSAAVMSARQLASAPAALDPPDKLIWNLDRR